MTAAHELWWQSRGQADRYALFQDDVECGPNLRWYLENEPVPARSYLNLYTSQHNHARRPSPSYCGWYRSNQLGHGALALGFDNAGFRQLLLSRHMIDKAKGTSWNYWLDGGVVTAMRDAGYHEYVHAPTLVTHTGHKSSIAEEKNKTPRARAQA